MGFEKKNVAIQVEDLEARGAGQPVYGLRSGLGPDFLGGKEIVAMNQDLLVGFALIPMSYVVALILIPTFPFHRRNATWRR